MEKCLSSLPPPPPSDNIRRTIDSDKVAMAWLTEQNFKDERTRVGFFILSIFYVLMISQLIANISLIICLSLFII